MFDSYEMPLFPAAPAITTGQYYDPSLEVPRRRNRTRGVRRNWLGEAVKPKTPRYTPEVETTYFGFNAAQMPPSKQEKPKVKTEPPKWRKDIPDLTRAPRRGLLSTWKRFDGPAERTEAISTMEKKVMELTRRNVGPPVVNDHTIIDDVSKLLQDPRYHPSEQYHGWDFLERDCSFFKRIQKANDRGLIPRGSVDNWLQYILEHPMTASAEFLARVVTEGNHFASIWFATAKRPSTWTPTLVDCALAHGKPSDDHDDGSIQARTVVISPTRSRAYIKAHRRHFEDLIRYTSMDDLVPAVAIRDVWQGKKVLVSAGQEYFVVLTATFTGRMSRSLAKLAQESGFPILVQRSADYYQQGVMVPRTGTEQYMWDKRGFQLALEQSFAPGQSLKQSMDVHLDMPDSFLHGFNMRHILGVRQAEGEAVNAVQLEVGFLGNQGIEVAQLAVNNVSSTLPQRTPPPPKASPCSSTPSSFSSASDVGSATSSAAQVARPSAYGVIIKPRMSGGNMDRVEGLTAAGELPLTAAVAVTVGDFPWRNYADVLNGSAHCFVSLIHKPGQISKSHVHAALLKIVNALPTVSLRRRPVAIHTIPREDRF